jgi:putrescine importer
MNEHGEKRQLGLASIVLFGLAYMTPIIVLGTFGILARETEGGVPAAYVVALIAMLFTAFSYSRMAKLFPTSGSAYTYTRKAVNSQLGFLVGWAVLLDYLFLPMVIWLIGASYLNSAFPAIPMWTWIVAFIVITTIINILGISVAQSINSILMVLQCLVLVAFVVLCIHYIWGDPTKALWSWQPFLHSGMHMPAVVAGAAVACYSFLGFDAVSTMTEEVRDPVRIIPRAILWVTLLGGLIFIAVSYFVQQAFPGGHFSNPDNAAFEIARNIGGDLFAMLFLIGLIIGQFASGLAAQASTSRLLFAMGRDGVLPRRFFGHLHPRFQTPVYNVILSGVLALLALGMDMTTSTSFINFGAFLAFSFVNLSVLCHSVRHHKLQSVTQISLYAIVPAVGLLADLYLLIHLDAKAITLGICWLVAGTGYLAYLTGMFRHNPPELDFAENA